MRYTFCDGAICLTYSKLLILSVCYTKQC